jgi:hypothetical protein
MSERLVTAGCAALIISVSSVIAAAQTPDRTPSAIVCLVLSPKLGLEPLVAQRLVLEVHSIWKVSGAEIRAVEYPDDGCTRLVVVKADLEALPEDVAHDDAIGWVPFVSGHARQLVFLRVNRARMMVDGVITGVNPEGLTNLMLAKLLGRTVAHELGHVLLNSASHADSGLMRARYRANDVLRVQASAYTLNAAERARLFTRMAIGSRVAVR